MPIAKYSCFILASLFISPVAQSYDFVPTDAEWQSWPGYCQAKYVWTNIGSKSKFVNAVGPSQMAELATWEAAGIGGVHHYCAGLVHLRRARMEDNPSRRDFLLRNALDEARWSFNRSSNKAAPQYGEVATHIATVLYEQREFAEAIQMMQDVLRVQPSNATLYSAIAVMQRKTGHLDDAKSTLLRGYAATDGQSAEINYNLGLICLELGEVDAAVTYAEKAYDLGFPLPGLRTKLQNLDRM